MNLQKTVTFIRWLARVWGSLILAFLLFMVIAHLVGDEESQGTLTYLDALTFVFFPLGTMLGLALAIKWDGLGGLITLISQLALLVIRPDLLQAGLISMAIGPAILYLIYWFYARSKKID